MISQLLPQEQIDAGFQRFLDQDAQAQAHVNSQSQQIADILKIDLSVLRRIETGMMLSQRASALGVDSLEYLLQFAVDTDEQRQQILLARSLQKSSTIAPKGLDYLQDLAALLASVDPTA